jgi:hypothetical protein
VGDREPLMWLREREDCRAAKLVWRRVEVQRRLDRRPAKSLDWDDRRNRIRELAKYLPAQA